MSAGLKIAKAWDTLHSLELTVDRINTAGYMQLCKDAGYSEDAVQRAGNGWMNARLDRKLSP